MRVCGLRVCGLRVSLGGWRRWILMHRLAWRRRNDLRLENAQITRYPTHLFAQRRELARKA